MGFWVTIYSFIFILIQIFTISLLNHQENDIFNKNSLTMNELGFWMRCFICQTCGLCGQRVMDKEGKG